MSKFKQAVSMRCTRQEYEIELAGYLKELGYEEQEHFKNRWDKPILVTNYGGLTMDILSREDAFRQTENDRYFIDHHNPELFKAIAAMREGDEVHVGEWVKCLRSEHTPNGKIREGKMYKASAIFIDGYNSKHWFRKATLEELVQHFTQKPEAVQPEPEFVYGLKVVCWDADEVRMQRIFLFNQGGTYPYVAGKESELEGLHMGYEAKITAFMYCIPVKQIKRSDIQSAFNCDEFEIID